METKRASRLIFCGGYLLPLILLASACRKDPDTHATFKFKGFYIGMPAQEVLQVMQEQNQLHVRHETSFGRPVLFGQGLRGGVVRAYMDRDGKLMILECNEFWVNNAFKVEDVDAPSFVKMFMKAYQIPEMQPITRQGFQGCQYQDTERGFEIAIFSGKHLAFRKLLKPGERQFD